MMAGLTVEERRQLGLAGYNIRDIRYLSQGVYLVLKQSLHSAKLLHIYEDDCRRYFAFCLVFSMETMRKRMDQGH